MAVIKGGDKLRAALEEMSKKVRNPATLQVGFLENATYPNGRSVAEVAAWQEFGTDKIPPRPFFRTMIKDKSPNWGNAIGTILERTDYDAARTLELFGEGVKGQLQQSIEDTLDPPLSPITLMLRKMKAENPDLEVTGTVVGEAARRVAAGESTDGVPTKPLFETGTLLNAVDSRVKT